ncbi:oxidoreductase [Desulfonema ishimotonii]|uniref:Oxidoreductase n=1 Tax=Desulfonema ishimotonii TaxID=45657 RepID=A0A401G3J7_9BACT|nr:Gfo/Idh/MocA family oxidoreductase [Desulfonema ishimotonii]GBC63773.1 oxidoreductase [Desulfonema ishimotonii]
MYNIAVIGCGYWGPNLIRNFSALSDCTVKMVCDLDETRLTHMKRLYPGIETTCESEHVTRNGDIDAVAVATPVRLHFEMARKSLLAGKHTFIEKPMASSVAECRELTALARQQQVTLMLGHTFIYSPPVRRIRELVDAGELGEIQYIRSRRLNLGLFQTDINVAWDLAPHDISIILYILGASPVSVNCQGKAHIHPEIEDVTNMTLNFNNGGLAIIQSSWLDPNKVREMTFVGSKKMLVYNDLEPIEKIKIYDKGVKIPPHYDTFAEFHYSYHYGDMYSPWLKQYEPLKEECQHFLDCIRTGEKPESCALEGLRVVQILEAASESLKKGGARVEIDPPDQMPEAFNSCFAETEGS